MVILLALTLLVGCYLLWRWWRIPRARLHGAVTRDVIRPVSLVGGVANRIVLRGFFRRRRARTVREALRQAISQLAGDVRAGADPNIALAAAMQHCGRRSGVDVRVVVEAANNHYRIADVLEAVTDFGETGKRLAALWRLRDTGIPLAQILDSLEADLSSAEALDVLGDAETAGIRATAALLGMLPLVGIGFGYALGADPLYVLVNTWLGAFCALTGVGLQLVGMWWTRRLANAWRVGR